MLQEISASSFRVQEDGDRGFVRYLANFLQTKLPNVPNDSKLEICALLGFTQRRIVACYGRFGTSYRFLLEAVRAYFISSINFRT
jgi:hypothetical protein